MVYSALIFALILTIRKINILLAEDDEDDRIFFQDAITEIGNNFHVSMVDNGDKVIDYFKTNPFPDFIFLDINMPLRNGLECLKLLRNLYPGNTAHTIILSTSANEKDILISRELGASAYIQKPGSFSELVAYLNYCLKSLSLEVNKDNFFLNRKKHQKF